MKDDSNNVRRRPQKNDISKDNKQEFKMSFKDELDNGWWWIYNDCCGMFCANLTMGLLIFAYWVQMKFILLPMEAFFSAILYTFFTFMAIWSHCRAQFTNPGTIPREYKAPFCKDARFGTKMSCRRSGVLKPPTAHYCREAKRVVLKMDHYCPWVNNVVGIFTQKYFLLFIFYTCLCTIFCGISLSNRFLSCREPLRRVPTPDGRHFTYGMKPWCERMKMFDVLFCILNFVEAVIFCIFTMCMCWDQYEAISENTPYIDRLQDKRGAEQPVYKSLCEVFGSDSPDIWWLIPVKPSQSLRDRFTKMCQDTYVALRDRPPREMDEYRRDDDVDNGASSSHHDNGDSNTTTYYDDADFHW